MKKPKVSVERVTVNYERTEHQQLLLRSADLDDCWVTVGDLKKLLEEHAIPDDAVLEYAGCGSHRGSIRW